MSLSLLSIRSSRSPSQSESLSNACRLRTPTGPTSAAANPLVVYATKSVSSKVTYP